MALGGSSAQNLKLSKVYHQQPPHLLCKEKLRTAATTSAVQRKTSFLENLNGKDNILKLLERVV